MDTFGHDPSAPSGLVYRYYGGIAVVAGLQTTVPSGNITLASSPTSYVERTYAGVVSSNTTGFTATNIPMAKVTTASGVITAVEDWRTSASPVVPYPLRTSEAAVTNARFAVGDPRRYGAVGDGTVDDTAAVQAALTAVGLMGSGLAGGVAYLAGGCRFKVTATLSVPSNVSVAGDGPASVILASAMGGMVVFLGDTIANASFDSFSITGLFGKGIAIKDSSRICISKCTISGATSPLAADGYAAAVHVYRCTDVVMDDNYCVGNGFRSTSNLTFDILCNGAGAYGYQRYFVRGNRCLSTDVHCNIGGYNLQDSTISGNECVGAYTRAADNSGYGILLYLATGATQWAATNPGPPPTPKVYNPGDLVYLGPTGGNGDIYECILTNSNQSPPNATYWILLDHGLRDNTVSDNNVHDTEGLGIYTANGRRTLVTNNQLRNVCSVMTEASLPAGAIGINGGGATVSHNRVDGSGGSGIVIAQNHVPCIVTSNVVSNVTGNAGIYLRGDCTGVRVADNVVENVSGTGIGSTNTAWIYTDVLVMGNRVANSGNGGIVLTTPTECTVSQNMVALSGAHGLWISGGGSKNTVSGNIVVDSSQVGLPTPPSFYSNIVIQTPQTTITGNITGNTLPNGAKYGISVDTAATVGSCVTGNVGNGNRTKDFSFTADLVAGGNVDTTNAGAFTISKFIQLTGLGPDGPQVLFGESSTSGAVGTVGSSGDSFMANNARHGSGASVGTWHQVNAAVRSVLILTRSVAGNNLMEIYVAVPGAADAVFASFWGSALFAVDANGFVKIAGDYVLKSRQTGWIAMAGTGTKGGFNTATVTLPQLAQVVKALLDKGLSDGSIGT